LLRCTSPLLAQSGHHAAEFQCLLLGVKRTSEECPAMSAFDPKRTLAAKSCRDAQCGPQHGRVRPAGEATRIHHTCRRRGGWMAARGGGAAAPPPTSKAPAPNFPMAENAASNLCWSPAFTITIRRPIARAACLDGGGQDFRFHDVWIKQRCNDGGLGN